MDYRVLDQLSLVQDFALVAVIIISGAVLGGWAFPSFDAWLPASWWIMRANAGLGLLLSAVVLVLPGVSRFSGREALRRLVTATIFLFGVLTVFEYITGHDLHIDTLFVNGRGSPAPGRMALQTAIFLSLVGLATMAGHARGALAALIDLTVVLMVGVTLLVLSGYAFGETRFYRQSDLMQTAPHTLVCMMLLSFVVVGRRAEHGYFRALVDQGVGGRSARGVLPIALVIPYVAVLGGAYLSSRGTLSSTSAAALTATTLSVAILVLVVGAAWWIIRLEQDLRDVSLTDPLTGVWNRRGFELFGEQAMRNARRADTSLSVLFFDLDNLKLVNDEFGHDAGSEYIRQVAALLRRSFRDSDIVARVGGDEFAIIVHGDRHDPHPELSRLDQAIAEFNRTDAERYTISYTHGEATRTPTRDEPLSELVARADAVMYERKRAKKRGPSIPSGEMRLKPAVARGVVRPGAPATSSDWLA